MAIKYELFKSKITQKYGLCVYDFGTVEQKELFMENAHNFLNQTYNKRDVKMSFATFYFMTESQRNWFMVAVL